MRGARKRQRASRIRGSGWTLLQGLLAQAFSDPRSHERAAASCHARLSRCSGIQGKRMSTRRGMEEDRPALGSGSKFHPTHDLGQAVEPLETSVS